MKMERDIDFMRQALAEAEKGVGRTAPNPAVGALIVKEGRVIGRGYHKKAGTPHAEINALASAVEDVAGATMYVTLEPCNHTGKTPPCSHAVAEAGIGRVVVGMADPNPLVDGTGMDYLREKGVEVVSGVLEKECVKLNLPFIKHITTGQPYIIMKAGISLDGRINYEKGSGGRVTGGESSLSVHQLRDKYDAILVGSATAIIDNPSLTTRLPGGGGRDPVRIVLDQHLSLPADAEVFNRDHGAYTWVFCGRDIDTRKVELLKNRGVKVSMVTSENGHLALAEVFREVGSKGLLSVLVEGGSQIHGAMLAKQLYDYAYLYQAPIFAGDGGVSLVGGFAVSDKTEAPFLEEVKITPLGRDHLIEGRLCYPS